LNVKQALADRLLPSELDAVSRMLDGYPNRGQAGKSYLGAIAATLTHYPKSVALACANPFTGVVLQSPEYLPSQSKVIQWCEKRCRSLYEEAEREDRIEKQLADREHWQGDIPSPRLKAMGNAWLDRSDPVARELIAPKTAETEKHREATLKAIEQANRRVFERECTRDGIDPARDVSPSLLRALKQPYDDGSEDAAEPPKEKDYGKETKSNEAMDAGPS
jgi:hypothetical protein